MASIPAILRYEAGGKTADAAPPTKNAAQLPMAE